MNKHDEDYQNSKYQPHVDVGVRTSFDSLDQVDKETSVRYLIKVYRKKK